MLVILITTVLVVLASSRCDASYDTPIIFVHGYQSSPGVWNTASSYFLSRGFSRIYTFDYQNNTGDYIENNAANLYKFLSTISNDNEAKIIIAHSMGGLVSRKMLIDNPHTIKTTKLVLLASPNHGALNSILCLDGCKLGFKFCPPCVCQMKPTSEFLKELNAKTKSYTTNTSILTYYTEKDELVRPSYSILDNALNLAYTSINTATADTKIENCTADTKIENCTAATTFGNSPNHGSVTNNMEILQTAENFINKKIKFLNKGPLLRNGDCSIWETDNIVRWDIPLNSPDSLLVNIRGYRSSMWDFEDSFFNVKATKQYYNNFSKKIDYYVRFFDPLTTTVSLWSIVRFQNSGFKCVVTITNNENILSDWNN